MRTALCLSGYPASAEEALQYIDESHTSDAFLRGQDTSKTGGVHLNEWSVIYNTVYRVCQVDPKKANLSKTLYFLVELRKQRRKMREAE